MAGVFPGQPGTAPPPAFMGWFFIATAGAFILIGWTYAICTVIAGRRLQRRRGYLFCMITAALNCANFPFGTALGVCTFIVLARPSVKRMFGPSKPTGRDFDLA